MSVEIQNSVLCVRARRIIQGQGAQLARVGGVPDNRLQYHFPFFFLFSSKKCHRQGRGTQAPGEERSPLSRSPHHLFRFHTKRITTSSLTYRTISEPHFEGVWRLQWCFPHLGVFDVFQGSKVGKPFICIARSQHQLKSASSPQRRMIVTMGLSDNP